MVADAEPLDLLLTGEFRRWLRTLADPRAKARISMRLRRLEAGQFGDVRALGGGVFELRIDYGPGYRIYCVRQTLLEVRVLCAGVKKSQETDIARARVMSRARLE
jgi:putative addiction module killer protein